MKKYKTIYINNMFIILLNYSFIITYIVYIFVYKLSEKLINKNTRNKKKISTE